MTRIPTTLLVAALVAAAGSACGPTAPADESADDGIDREMFLDVYVELRRAQRTAPDSAAFEGRKRRIFERHDVTPAMLDAFVRRHAHDIEFLVGVWQEAGERIAASDTTAAPTDAGANPGSGSGAAPDGPAGAGADSAAGASKTRPGMFPGRGRDEPGPPEVRGRPDSP